ncbi:MAG: hypothetical protein KME18_12680 [Phormidium tanganyikae FI6-MK23]|nr:hypothetical protein [Phormidium tanganyikae FI6-MK23]
MNLTKSYVAFKKIFGGRSQLFEAVVRRGDRITEMAVALVVKVGRFVSNVQRLQTNGAIGAVSVTSFVGNCAIDTTTRETKVVNAAMRMMTIVIVVVCIKANSVFFRKVAQKSRRISYKEKVNIGRWLMLEFTGAAIVKLAFDEAVKAGAGEVAKKAVGGAIEKLRSAIKARFKGKNQKAEEAIVKIEQERSPEALNKLSVYLDDEMDDPQFAQTLQQLAQQVINIGKQEQNSATFNIDARDQARVNAINELNATTVNFGDQRP